MVLRKRVVDDQPEGVFVAVMSACTSTSARHTSSRDKLAEKSCRKQTDRGPRPQLCVEPQRFNASCAANSKCTAAKLYQRQTLAFLVLIVEQPPMCCPSRRREKPQRVSPKGDGDFADVRCHARSLINSCSSALKCRRHMLRGCIRAIRQRLRDGRDCVRSGLHSSQHMQHSIIDRLKQRNLFRTSDHNGGHAARAKPKVTQ